MRRWFVASLLVLIPVLAAAQQPAPVDDSKLAQIKLDVCQWQLDSTKEQLSRALAQAQSRIDVLQKQVAAQTPPETPQGGPAKETP